QPRLVASRPLRPGPRRHLVDSLLDVRTAHPGDRRAARGDRRRGRDAAVGARARPRVPPGQSDLLQLLRQHREAPPLPVREPPGALRPLGGGARGAGSARDAARRKPGLRTMVRRALKPTALGTLLLLVACAPPWVGLF